MLEGKNLEIAQELAKSKADSEKSLRENLIEIAEAIVLSLIAVATAWCGYQAAKWDGLQESLYATSARLRVEAAIAVTEGGQQRLLDVLTFNSWIQAKEAKNEELAANYERRFSAEYRVAFNAWLKTEPFKNPKAPAGPSLMPEYHNALLKQGERLDKEATVVLTEGTEAREKSHKYVRSTVLLSMVLFLIALSQRFRLRKVRAGLLLIAAMVMAYALVNLVIYPRL